MSSLVDLNGNPVNSGNTGKEQGKQNSDNQNSKEENPEGKVNFDFVIDNRDLKEIESKGLSETLQKYLNEIPKVLYGLANHFDIKKFYIYCSDDSSDLEVKKESMLRLIPADFKNYNNKYSSDEGTESDSEQKEDDSEQQEDSNKNN